MVNPHLLFKHNFYLLNLFQLKANLFSSHFLSITNQTNQQFGSMNKVNKIEVYYKEMEHFSSIFYKFNLLFEDYFRQLDPFD